VPTCSRERARGDGEGDGDGGGGEGKGVSCYDTPGDRRFRSSAGGRDGVESRDVCRTRYLANKTTWRRTVHPRVAVRG